MALFGRKKRLSDLLDGLPDSDGPFDPGMTMPSPAEGDYGDPSAGDVGGGPRHKGFNWGRAALGFVGGPRVVSMLREKDALELQQQKYQEAQQQAQQLLETAKSVIKDPTEWVAFQADPKKWAETRLGDQYGFHDLAQGHTGLFGNPAQGGNAYTAPETFNNGPDRVQYDGNNGQSQVVYHGKDDWTRYADSMGLRPGTPEYNAAQKDFAMKAYGPSGFGVQQALQSQQIAGQMAVHSAPTYGDTHPNAGGRGKVPLPTSTRVVGGKAYYKVRGQWYDNPEGR